MAKRFVCIIAWPAGHSRSPLIHNYWIKQHGLDAEYKREAVPPHQFAEFLARMPEHGYVGANCTVPHKEAALKLSTPDERAQAVGAANCLWFDGPTLRSTNTDVEGFLGNLDEAAPSWDRSLKSAVVLGAGGGARGVVFGLLSRGAEAVHLVNRTRDRAEALRAKFGERVHPASFDDLPKLLPRAGLLVNATSIGMVGQPPLPVDLAGAKSLVVTDIVYAPLETELLAQARKRGLRTADGLGMLLHQAVRGFQLWFGVKPKVTPELRALVEADLKKS